MADDPTLGELARNLDRLERRMERTAKDADDRLTKTAADMVTAELSRTQHRALEEDIKHLDTDMRDGFARVERTSLERKAALDGQITALRKGQEAHARSHAEKASWSRSKTLTVVGITVGATATVAGAWIAALLAAGGVH